MPQIQRIGVLTGGGDCPGLNAVIRAVVRKGVFHYHDEFVGFMEGWRGLIEDKHMPLDLDTVGGILPRGGTILRTSRTNPSKRPDGIEHCLATIAKNKIDALIAIGATVVRIPFEAWWHVLTTRRFDGASGVFFHPVAETEVVAGNATIGAEIAGQRVPTFRYPDALAALAIRACPAPSS